MCRTVGNPIAPRKILSALLILSSPPGSTSHPSLAKYSAPAFIISQLHLNPPMISDDLRRQADNFIELEELKDVLGRPQREFPEKPEEVPSEH